MTYLSDEKDPLLVIISQTVRQTAWLIDMLNNWLNYNFASSSLRISMSTSQKFVDEMKRPLIYYKQKS